MTRYAWSEALADVSAWLCERLAEIGLEATIDPAGNVLGKWEAGSGKAVVVGSHLDTVPRGGRYDGALGVLAGLDAIRRLKARGVEPSRPVWLASFMDEEGSRFRTGMLGSRAFVGDAFDGLDVRLDEDGVSLREAMAARGFDFDRLGAAAAVEEVGAYLELHIEQGPCLDQSGVDVGVVTSIVGILTFKARLAGEANHAGTTPMETRRDALAGAARAGPSSSRPRTRHGRNDRQCRHHLGRAGRLQRDPGGLRLHDRRPFVDRRGVRGRRALRARDPRSDRSRRESRAQPRGNAPARPADTRSRARRDARAGGGAGGGQLSPHAEAGPATTR